MCPALPTEAGGPVEAGGGPQNITREASEFGPKSKKMRRNGPRKSKRETKFAQGIIGSQLTG